MEVFRFDYNGLSSDFKRTPQGFLRVSARLSRTGIFRYDSGKEYRSEDEVFKADSLLSIKGAPVTDLHPSEKGAESFLTPANAKEHIIGIAESVERDGEFLTGSLLVFHEDAIKAIESGDRREISLGYTCRIDATPGSINGEAYDAVQRDIVVNHVAIGPAGWGRAGAECSIRKDSHITPQGKIRMDETIRLDNEDMPFTVERMKVLFDKKRNEFMELKGRFDAMSLELEKVQQAKSELENPHTIEAKVQSRLKLIEQCRKILGDKAELDGKGDDEIKLEAIKSRYPQHDLENKDAVYVDGMFAAILASLEERNDSLTTARKALEQPPTPDAQAYKQWLDNSAKMWTTPLTGSRS